MKHISIFQTNTDYESKKNQLSQPQIVYVQDDDIIYCTNACTNTSTNITNGNTTNVSSYIDNSNELNYENLELLD